MILFPMPANIMILDVNRVMVDTSLKFNLQISGIYGKIVGVTSSILRGILCRSPEFMVKCFVTHVLPHH